MAEINGVYANVININALNKTSQTQLQPAWFEQVYAEHKAFFK